MRLFGISENIVIMFSKLWKKEEFENVLRIKSCMQMHPVLLQQLLSPLFVSLSFSLLRPPPRNEHGSENKNVAGIEPAL